MKRSILKMMKSYTFGPLQFFLILMLSAAPIHGAAPGEGRLDIDSHIDWMRGLLQMELHYTPSPGASTHSAIRQRAIEKTRKELPSLLLEALGDMNIDSRTKLREMLISSPDLVSQLRVAASSGTVHIEGFNRDFSSFTRKYTFPLYPDIAELFLFHPRAVPQIPMMEYVASGNYSGIVIYVDGPLPLYGSTRVEKAHPALFPKVYSRDMECIINSSMVSPEKIRQGGMVRYYSKENIDMIHARVGEVPLYVHAVGLFGITPTDLIVSERSARQLRADEHTLSLIRDGKIAIVYSQFERR